jgi:transposase
MCGIDISRLVFIDEASANISMTRRYGRAMEGQRLHGSAPYRWGDNVTMIGAMGFRGLRTVMTVEGGTTEEVFRAFTERCLVPVLLPTDIVVLDNLSSHKVPGVRESIESTGAQAIYLPPYSPDLNPIELCWSKLKDILRRVGARTRDALDESIAYAMKQISTENAIAWFSHCGYCFQDK